MLSVFGDFILVSSGDERLGMLGNLIAGRNTESYGFINLISHMHLFDLHLLVKNFFSFNLMDERLLVWINYLSQRGNAIY